MTTESRRTPDEHVIGTVIGHYRVTEVLNQGGMGAVYRAEHPLIGKPAVIKLLLPDLSANEEMVRRFFNEAKAASAIRHPGIVEIFDFGYHSDGRAYIVMEFLDGQSLGERLVDRGRLAELEAAVLTRSIAGALAAAHAKNIVHRDLKPDNVFLVPDPDMPTGERAKVLDFGIAKLTGDATPEVSRTRTGAMMGTPLYMAPEQARGAGDVDARADLYALGCMLYEMLCGAPPFVAEGSGEIIAMQLFAEPVPPREIVPELSEEIARVVMSLLEKDPAKRPQQAKEVVDALATMMPRLSGRLSAAVPVPPKTTMRPIATPRPVAAASPASTSAPAPAPKATTLGGSAAHVVPSLPPEVPARSSKARFVVAAALAVGAAAAAFAIVKGVKGGDAAASPPTTSPPTTATTPKPEPPSTPAAVVTLTPDAGMPDATPVAPAITTPTPPPAPPPAVVATPTPTPKPPAHVTRPHPHTIAKPVPPATNSTKPTTTPPPKPTTSPNGSPIETNL